MKRSSLYIPLLLILVSTTLFVVPSWAASTIYVPGDYQTIQDAINRASEGDIIRVASGIYNETITNSNRKGISIIGEDRETTFITGVASNSPYNVLQM